MSERKHYHFDEIRDLDNAILNLATYAATNGEIYVPSTPKAEDELKKTIVLKFNRYKRGIKYGEYTYVNLRDMILRQHGPFKREPVSSDPEKAVDDLLQYIKDNPIGEEEEEEKSFSSFGEFLSMLASQPENEIPEMPEVLEMPEMDEINPDVPTEFAELDEINDEEVSDEILLEEGSSEEEFFADMMRKDMRIKDAQQMMTDLSKGIESVYIGESFSDSVDAILNCKGKIITTGMGKAGMAMKKFSSILCSFGIPSCYLHPGEASHGDLGLISNSDILFVASTSGKTREVMEIIDLARNIDVKTIIGLTSHEDSPIKSKADLIIDMGEMEEAGYLGLAPTSSILVMIAITDCLASTCAREKRLTKEQYGKFHHGGYLGGKAREDGNIF